MSKIRFCSIVSGSSGNCVYLETEQTKILIDAGGTGKEIEDSLRKNQIDPFKLNAIFITHEHMDHIKSVGVCSRRFDVPIYATHGTWKAMKKKKILGKIIRNHQKIIEPGEEITINDMNIKATSIYHDAKNPICYSIYSDGDTERGIHKAFVMTDTGRFDDDIIEAAKLSTVIFLEANYEVELLDLGSYPQTLKTRIKSKFGHMSNYQCGEFLSKVLKGKYEKVLLGHLSENNNAPRLAYETVKTILSKNNLINETVKIGVAPRYEPSQFIETVEML